MITCSHCYLNSDELREQLHLIYKLTNYKTKNKPQREAARTYAADDAMDQTVFASETSVLVVEYLLLTDTPPM